MDALGIKLIERHRDRARGLVVVDDGERHDHPARPVAHVPEIHMEPFAEKQHLARNRRDVFPREQPDEREIQFGKRVHARHAAEVQRHLARTQHPRVGHGNAGKFQREIRLDGGVHFRRAAVIDVPAAVRQLHGEDFIDRLAFPFLVRAAVPVMKHHHVRNQRGIHHEFANPVTLRFLFGQKKLLRPLEGGLDGLRKFVWHPDAHGGRRRLRPGITLSQHILNLRICENAVKNLLAVSKSCSELVLL